MFRTMGIVGVVSLLVCGCKSEDTPSGSKPGSGTASGTSEQQPPPAEDLTVRATTPIEAEVKDLGLVNGDRGVFNFEFQLEVASDGALATLDTTLYRRTGDTWATIEEQPSCMGYPLKSPTLDTDADGELVAGGIADKQLCVLRFRSGLWLQLGDRVGKEGWMPAAFAASPDGPVLLRGEALDGGGEAISSWRWDGSTWQALPPLGEQGERIISYGAIGTPDGVAVVWLGGKPGDKTEQATVRVAVLDKGGAWTVAPPVKTWAAVSGYPPQIARTGDGTLVVAFREGEFTVNVYRRTPGAAAWVKLAESVGNGPMVGGPGSQLWMAQLVGGRPAVLLRHDGKQWHEIKAGLAQAESTWIEHLAIGPDGGLYVLWSEGTGTTKKLRVAKVEPKA